MDPAAPRLDSAKLTVLTKEQVAQIVAMADVGTKVAIPDAIPQSAVRLLAIKYYECLLVCKDERDCDQVLESFVTAAVMDVGSVIGYIFGRKQGES